MGGVGEEKTVNYLIEQFQAAGLEPGGENGGWTQIGADDPDQAAVAGVGDSPAGEPRPGRCACRTMSI